MYKFYYKSSCLFYFFNVASLVLRKKHTLTKYQNWMLKRLCKLKTLLILHL